MGKWGGGRGETNFFVGSKGNEWNYPRSLNSENATFGNDQAFGALSSCLFS